VHILSFIFIRKNASCRTRKSRTRNEQIHLIQKIGYGKDKQIKTQDKDGILKLRSHQ
jgi:hypothetical protein